MNAHFCRQCADERTKEKQRVIQLRKYYERKELREENEMKKWLKSAV